MSDLEDDLLGLLEEDEAPKPSKRPASPRPAAEAPAAKKRRKARQAGSGSDMDMSDASSSEYDAASPPHRRATSSKALDFESDDDDDERGGDATPEALYPYRGVYKSRDEYKELQNKSELEREAIIGQRQEEIQALRDRQNLKQLLASRDANVDGGRAERKKTQTGRTEAKASALDKLRKSRRSKAARTADAPDDDDEYGAPKRTRAADYSDDYTSGEDTPHSRRSKQKAVKEVERVERSDMAQLQLPRWRFAQSWTYPWFEEYIKGAWVRVSLGPNKKTNELVYLLAEVAGLGPRTEEPYMVETQVTDVQLLLKHGKSTRIFSLDQISGSDFTLAEYSKLLNTLEQDGSNVPTKKDFLLKKVVIDKYKHANVTEADLSHSLRQKAELKKRHGPALARLDLRMKRLAAKERGDATAVQSLDAEILALTQEIANAKIAKQQAAAAVPGTAANGNAATPVVRQAAARPADAPRDALAALNERNRLANRQAVRKAELAGRTLAKAASEGGALDPSARVKTTVRLMHDVSEAPSRELSRAPSPTLVENPIEVPPMASMAAGPGVRSEQAIAAQVQVDLGDF